MDEMVEWEVIPPRSRASVGGPKPMGSVRIAVKGGKAEYVNVPACVTRSLIRHKKSGDMEGLTKDELLSALDRITAICARQRISQLVARRDYSQLETLRRLKEDGFTDDEAQTAVGHAVNIGLVCDKRFADAYIRGKIFSGWGMERIERELAHRGIEARELEGWPYEYLDPDDEYDRAMQVARRKTVREPNAYAKLARFLVNRGFTYAIASSVAKEVLAVAR
ncbi:MAG: regulatory protein RecX [Atopobiaceae bacterium]|nr:regulatory protein RecX [Atopobiaceae bacterium]